MTRSAAACYRSLMPSPARDSRSWPAPLALATFCALSCSQQEGGENAPDDEREPHEAESAEPNHSTGLTTYGELRRINMQGDISPSVDLRDGLQDSAPLNHAVGALGELSGEITVWGDDVYLAHAGDELRFSASSRANIGDDHDATLLFGTHVAAWKDVPLQGASAPDLKDLEDLEDHLGEWQSEQNQSGALPFRIVDPAASADWHVIDDERLPEGATSCDERKEHAHQFQTRDAPLRIVGLYSTDHTGIIVDHTTSIHAHVITDDDRTGHLDPLDLSGDAHLEIGLH